jgi:hypothetical protein
MFPRSCFFVCIAPAILAGALFAQGNGSQSGVPGISVGGSTWFSIVTIPPVPNAPFSATAVLDSTQALPDGSADTRRTETTIARDSKGRTHNENRYWIDSSAPPRIRDITIVDPVAQTRTTLTPETLEATVRHLPNRPQKDVTAPDVQREDLGVSTVDGLSIRMFRQTKTIPAGAQGNSAPLTITDEYWYSDDLQMNVRIKHQDPRHGTQVVTLTQLNREEPDPKLFEIPTGYSVNDQRETQGAVQISAAVAEANLTERVEPQCPALAKAAQVHGSVEFMVVIGEDGSVKSAQLVRGHPLLVDAARQALLQWKYHPTLLNDKAISVSAPVTVSFTSPECN